MNATTALLVVCLAVTTLGQQCTPRPKPRFDCRNAKSGIFFPHPEDCTFLVFCAAGQDVEISLCEEVGTEKLNKLGHYLGCPGKCALIQPSCSGTTTAPPTTVAPFPSAENPMCHFVGLFPNPQDCMKAFFCPNLDVIANSFNICNNIDVDSTFPVGCPEKCPGWKPGVMHNNFPALRSGYVQE